MGKVTRENIVLKKMQSDDNSKSSLYVIERINDSIPEGIAASIIVTLYCKSVRPKKETIINAIISLNNIISLLNKINQ